MKKFWGSQTKFTYLLASIKLLKKPAALKREHPALKNMKFLIFFPTFVGHFCPP